MAQLPGAFDSNQHDDMTNFDPVPKGEYLVIIKSSEIKETKAKTGKYISFQFEIIAGDFKGRFIWTNLNIKNPNPVAEEIAQKELATICRACGKTVIQDTLELHGTPMLMKVKIVPEKDDYPAKNAPVNYRSPNSTDEGNFEPDENEGLEGKDIFGEDDEEDHESETEDEGSIPGDEEDEDDDFGDFPDDEE